MSEKRQPPELDVATLAPIEKRTAPAIWERIASELEFHKVTSPAAWLYDVRARNVDGVLTLTVKSDSHATALVLNRRAIRAMATRFAGKELDVAIIFDKVEIAP